MRSRKQDEPWKGSAATPNTMRRTIEAIVRRGPTEAEVHTRLYLEQAARIALQSARADADDNIPVAEGL